MTREEIIKSKEYIFAQEACKHGEQDAIQAFEEGAEYGYKFAVENGGAWHDAESDDLPLYDKEVIALLGTEPYYMVCFAHRPDPNGWDGKNIATGKIEHYQAETYGKGGWNIYGVKWWLDVELPKRKEEGI